MYVKLVRQGHRIDVVPDYLFYYRHRATSLLRTTDNFLNRRRVLRQFFQPAELPRAEQIELWTALASFDEEHQRRLLAQPVPPQKHRTGMRLAVYRVKTALRQSTYYTRVSSTLKKLKKRAA
jgi:hypothetical protein